MLTVPKPTLDLTYNDSKGVFDVNVSGVFNTARAVAKLCLERKQKGLMVITSSIHSQIIRKSTVAAPFAQVFYNAFKAVISKLAKGLAAEWL
ncbi:uncharacterized protein LACBIDRAFT_310725 [Laccaria bicolor S238N-H82]|uniref:Predicted protein n=1 Tax=Laccaria bicolor (strain S238N-H82 / ATCC MYA-4686) TaxID=486041 RepID=B0DUZ1_LACBS|nr:uncharacterized protein LACBIDRAFT_310725 [Laccaria bicolor S238N-H82]EDR01696.1 predicted protein [Laccaria bicolor S238N-H82]|eukprot:XP_001887772.1 predicted protein [Laccaria bicolor S238N-H82]